MFRIVIGMSDDLKSIRDKIRDQTDQLVEHLIKLALFPECDSIDHWRAEVYSFLNKVPRIKGKNSWPKYKLIREPLSIYEDMVDELVDHVKKDYKNLSPVPINPIKLQNMITAYNNWLASELSQRGRVDSDDVFAKLEELGF